MNPDRWARVSACLDALLDLSRDERAASLARLHRDDPDLCAEVESLLDSDAVSPRLETPPTNLLEMASSVRLRAAHAAEPPQPHAAGRFVLHDEIARGGMGIIYRATDPDIRRPLAVKVLAPALRDDPEAVARFAREARITGRLQHPGIPPIHELGRLDDGTPFFAMKLIEGRTLAALVSRGPPTRGDGELIGTFEQICRTVAYAHSQGTLHRDLKPSNVMVGSFGEVQVMDWGLAKQLKIAKLGLRNEAENTGPSSDSQSTFRDLQYDETGAGEVRGTPAYMAPEQARGESDSLDERCDVFGLGGILCALLTGEPPYTGSASEMLQQACARDVSGALARLDRCGADPDLLVIARKCLAPAEENRYRNAGELAEAVTVYRASVRQKLERAELERHTAQVQAASERHRRLLALGLGSALLLVLLLGLGFVTRFWLLAEDRRGQAETARQHLKEERDRTEETARQARQAIKDSFVLATENPEFQKDGMQEARRLLLDKALTYFRVFAAQRGNDPALREDLADAHQRIAYILADRGQLQDALTEYGRAVELVDQLQKDQPDEMRRQLKLIDLHLLRAGAQLKLGQRDEARKSLARSRAFLDPLLKAEPANPEYRFANAQVIQLLGHIDSQEGRLDDALTAYSTALDTTTKLYDAGFQKVKVAALAADSLVSMGHILKDQRKYADAEKRYQQAIKPREDILKAVPGPHSRSELARVYGSLAIVQSYQGQTEKAFASSRRAIELREELVRANPRVPDYRHELATSYVNFADDLRGAAEQKGKIDPESHRYREKALAEFLTLVKSAPEQVSYHHGAAVAHLGLAMVYRRELKWPEQAREHLTAARDIWLDLDKRGLTTPEHRFNAAECEKQFGLLFLGINDFTKASEHFLQARTMYRNLRDTEYKADACRCEIARNTSNLAIVAQNTGKFDAALKLQAEALDVIEELAREKPNDAEFQRSAKFTRTNMLELAKLVVQKTVPAPAKGTTGAELLAYHQARSSQWQKLGKDFPKMTEFRAEAANELVRVARLHAARLKLDSGLTPDERRVRLNDMLAVLKQAKEFGFNAQRLDTDPAFAHCKNEPVFQQFVKSAK